MKKIISFVLLLVWLQSSDVLDKYRLNGIDGIEQELDLLLTQKEYWSEHLQNIDTKYGYYEDIKHIVLSDKSKPSLTLFNYTNSTFVQDSTIKSLVGEMQGDKSEEGDLKTPIGVYDLVDKLNDVDQFYGPMAFVTSYPNLYDRLLGKTGHGIWIHGLPLSGDREVFTKGCVAIDNTYLEAFSTKIDYKKTLLIISENQLDVVSKDDILLILSSLYRWNYDWKYSNYDDYISFYHKNFIRFDSKKLDWFKSYKKQVFKNTSYKSIRFSNINIAPYPNNKKQKQYRITFHEDYRSNTTKFQGNKELYVVLEDGTMKILVEK